MSKKRPNNIIDNSAEKRNNILSDLIKKAKEKGLIHSIKYEDIKNNNTKQ